MVSNEHPKRNARKLQSKLRKTKLLGKASKIFCWLPPKLMIKRRRELKKIGKISNRKPEKGIFLTRMLLQQRRKKKIRLELFKLLRMNSKSFKTRFKDTRLKLKSYRN